MALIKIKRGFLLIWDTHTLLFEILDTFFLRRSLYYSLILFLIYYIILYCIKANNFNAFRGTFEKVDMVSYFL